MIRIPVYLNSMTDAKHLVQIAEKCTDSVDLACGRYVVDAKSIMGIFSLELSKPLALHINSDDEKEINAVLKTISAVLVSE